MGWHWGQPVVPVPPSAGEGASEGLEGAWLVQGELPLHPSLLRVWYLLHGPRNAVSSLGLSFSVCEMGTCITECLYGLGSVGAAHLLPFVSKHCWALCLILWVKTPDGKLPDNFLPGSAQLCSFLGGGRRARGDCVLGWMWVWVPEPLQKPHVPG